MSDPRCDTMGSLKKVNDKLQMAKEYSNRLACLINELFFFSAMNRQGKPFNACTGSLLISLKRRFQLIKNNVIKHDLCFVGHFYSQLNQLANVLPS